MKKKKIAFFAACGQAYADEFAQIRSAYQMAARYYHAKGYALQNNFIFAEFDALPPCEVPMDTMPDQFFTPRAFEENGQTRWEVVLQEVSVVVPLCDADDPDQTDELARVSAVCKKWKRGLRPLFYHSQNWSTPPA